MWAMQDHRLDAIAPFMGPSTFSTIPGVTAANINSKVSCIEPADMS